MQKPATYATQTMKIGDFGLAYIQPRHPMQNDHVESFQGRLRDECVNANLFRILNDVHSTLAADARGSTARSTTEPRRSSGVP
ncbi:MAG: integrase core domain-containing protein [Acidobacteriaceae bacterium]